MQDYTNNTISEKQMRRCCVGAVTMRIFVVTVAPVSVFLLIGGDLGDVCHSSTASSMCTSHHNDPTL